MFDSPIASCLFAAIILTCACNRDDQPPAAAAKAAQDTKAATTPEVPKAQEPPQAGPMPQAWVDKRVSESRARLAGNEAGQLVWKAIEAHGGLQAWLSAGSIEFEFDYQPLAEPARRMHSMSRVDLWRSRAHQKELGEGADAELGWDGEQAWITPDAEAFPSPARFWATTPYYFVGIPWVFADPGARFTRLADDKLFDAEYKLVKVGYETGTGDAPDDYYILYIHAETHRVDAIRYVVSYPGFFPEGGHSPEKLMRYLEQRPVQGLQFAHRYATHKFDAEGGEVGDKVTDTTISRIRLGQTYPADIFSAPKGAEISQVVAR